MIRFWTSSRNFFRWVKYWWFSSVCFNLWLCSFPCGPGSHEVDVLSVRPRFRRSWCFIRAAPVQTKLMFYPCGPGSDEVDVRTSSFIESNRSRFVILVNKMRMRKLFRYILLFFKSWICSLLKSSSNFFSYVHLRCSVRSKSNPSFCWLEF